MTQEILEDEDHCADCGAEDAGNLCDECDVPLCDECASEHDGLCSTCFDSSAS